MTAVLAWNSVCILVPRASRLKTKWSKETKGSEDENALFVFTGSQSMRVVHSNLSDCYVIVSVKWEFAHQLHMRNKEWIVWNQEDSPLKMEISLKLHMP